MNSLSIKNNNKRNKKDKIFKSEFTSEIILIFAAVIIKRVTLKEV